MSYVPANVQAAVDAVGQQVTALSQAVASAVQAINTAQTNLNTANADLRSLLTATWPAPPPPPPVVEDPGLIKVDTTGKTDVTSAIQAVYNKAKTLGTATNRFKVSIPAGTYLVDAVTGIWPLGNTDTVVHKDAIFKVIPNDQPNARLWRYYKVDNWSHVGGQYYGDRDTHNYVIIQPEKLPNDGQNTHEWGHCFAVGGCKNWRIAETYIEAFGGDACSVGAWKEARPWVRSANGVFENNSIKDCRRQGISATNCDACTFRDNTIADIGVTNGTSPRCGIDLEPDNDESIDAAGVVRHPATVAGRNTNNVIIGNIITGCAVFGVNGFLRVDNLKMSGNMIGRNKSRGLSMVNVTGLDFGPANTIYENGSEGLVVGKDTTQFDVHDNIFRLNYQKQSPVAKTGGPVNITGAPTGHRDLYVVVPANGNVGSNNYA